MQALCSYNVACEISSVIHLGVPYVESMLESEHGITLRSDGKPLSHFITYHRLDAVEVSKGDETITVTTTASDVRSAVLSLIG